MRLKPTSDPNKIERARLLVSSDLKIILERVAEEDFKSKEADIQERLSHYKSLILKIEKAKKFDLIVWLKDLS